MYSLFKRNYLAFFHVIHAPPLQNSPTKRQLTDVVNLVIIRIPVKQPYKILAYVTE